MPIAKYLFTNYLLIISEIYTVDQHYLINLQKMHLKLFFSISFIFVATVLTAQKRSSVSVNFDFNKYEITPATASTLDSLISFIGSTHFNFNIELYGHCDSIGSNEYNDSLSVKRTEAVKNYLAGNGVQSNTITKEEGLGKRQPVNTNASDYERFLNRRVVVTLTSIEIPVIAAPVVPEVKQPEQKKEESIEIPVNKTISDVVLDPKTKIGTKIRLKNLNFIGNRHVLLPESIMPMMELIEVMENNPNLEISIEGHICCKINKEDWLDDDLGTYNLSEMRAKTVYDYLIKMGIDAQRLSYKGFGHMYPIYPYPEYNEDERISNRRVEIRIIKK